jgi:thiol-disulfide isomerase/thioredoxin
VSRTTAGLLLALALALGACSDDANTVAGQARQGDQKGYISGDGTVQTVPEEDRDLTIELAGTTLEGEEWDSADARGSVLVVNVWGSWCGPCKAEAPDLQAAYEHFTESGEPVEFIGVNDRDSQPTALAFQRAEGVGYPSLVDDGGQTLVALEGMANARPSTLVLDEQGRLAARVSGQVDETTLRGLVEDVLAG